MVNFNTIPSDIRASGVYAEINAQPKGESYYNRMLVIGHVTDDAKVAAGEYRLASDDLIGDWGNGSMLFEAIRSAKAAYPGYRIFGLAVAEPATGGVKATATITVNADVLPVAVPRQAVFYLGSRAEERLAVPVYVTDTAATLAARIASAVNAGYAYGAFTAQYGVVATVASNVVTLTARHKGVVGNTLKVATGVHALDDDFAATGLTITAFSAGAGLVDLAAALANLGAEAFDTLASPWCDATALEDVAGFLADREQWDEELYGHYFSAQYDTFANLYTAGAARNSQYYSVVGVKQPLDPSWRLAAELAAHVANWYATGNRRRGMKGIVLAAKAVTRKDGWTVAERDQLLRVGVTPLTVGMNGRFAIDRNITAYRTNADGVPDTTWLDVSTRYRTIYAVRNFRDMLIARYQRSARNDDIAAAIGADLDHKYIELEDGGDGILVNSNAFRSARQVQRDGLDRIDIYAPLAVRADLHVIAINATIRVS